MKPQTFRNNDFDKETMPYCEFPNRDKNRNIDSLYSSTEQKLWGRLATGLASGKIEFTNKVTIEIVAFEQDDNCGLQPT